MSKRKTTPPKARRSAPVVVKQPKPWGTIIAAIVTVLFAVAVIGYAVMATADRVEVGDELPGVESYEVASANHVEGTVTYEQTPPVGGDHSNEWADCTGTVYPNPIPSENAVHGLEHGAAWITYNPETLSESNLEELQDLVTGNNFTMLSPYEGLDTPVSLQSWSNQLKLDSFDLKQVQDFLRAYKTGPDTPEQGATCSNPQFAGLA